MTLKLEPAAKRQWESRRALPKRVGGIAKVLAREQVESTHPAARAQAILPESVLRRKLGASTYRVWSTLLTLRNDACETHPSMPGLARATRLGEAQVSKSLARLREFKLLEDFGFQWLQVPCRCDPEVGTHEHKVWLRRVYGMLKADRTGQVFTALVPSETARLVKEAAGQGGARAGAGRPRTKPLETKQEKSNVGAYRNQELSSSEEPKGSSSERGVTLRAKSGKTKSPKFTQREKLREALKRFMAYQPPSLQRTGGEPVPTPSQPQAVAVTNFRLSSAEQPAPAALGLLDGQTIDLFDAIQQRREGQFTLSGGAGLTYRRPQRYSEDDIRVTSQLAAQVQVERTPAPPRVQADQTEVQRLALLRVAYKAAHAKALRQEFWRPARQQSGAERKAMVEAAEALLAENISPHAWALFSFLAWQRMGKKTAPGAKWVWSAQRIHEHAQWCHETTGTQDSGKPLKCPSVTQLLHALGRLQQRLGYGRPTHEVVCEVLPDAHRRVLLAKAATEREAARQDIERRILAGEWVW